MFRIVNTVRIVAHHQYVGLAERAVSCFGRKAGVSNIRTYAIKTGIWHKTTVSIESGRFRVVCALQKRPFHTSGSRRGLPPLLYIILRPVAKIIAILFGRSFRKWWGSLPPERKKAFLLNVKRNKAALFASGIMSSVGITWYYTTHLVEDTITGRRKFIAFSNDQLMQISQMELEMQVALNKEHFLPSSHPVYRRVAHVANHLLKCNKDLPQVVERNWAITVIDDPIVRNAFVLPTGHIFIFTGMLDVCSNDDQLCVILAHEISHVLLSHVAEQMSTVHLMDLLVLLPLAFLWAVLPDGAALLAQWLSGYFAKVLFHLPFSRALEAEADQVGLQLTAKACYDVREASAFWAKMKTEGAEFEWLSTHPSTETRQFALDALMPIAVDLREKCKCPMLPAMDPRTLITITVEPKAV